MRLSLFFHSFCGKDGGDQTRHLTVHNLISCLRRHCEEVDWKCYAANATTIFCLLKSFFHHTGVRKRGTSIENIPQLLLPRSSHGHVPVPLKRMLLGRRNCLYVTNQYTPTMRILFTVCWTDSSAGIVNIWLASTIQSASRHLCLRHGYVCKSVLEIETEVPIFCQVYRGTSRPPERGTPT